MIFVGYMVAIYASCASFKGLETGLSIEQINSPSPPILILKLVGYSIGSTFAIFDDRMRITAVLFLKTRGSDLNFHSGRIAESSTSLRRLE